MINEDLITYIQAQRRKNISDNEISSRLAKAGWHPEDIQEGFIKIKPPIVASRSLPTPTTITVTTQALEINEPVKVADVYRETPEIVAAPIIPITIKEPTPTKIEAAPVIEATPVVVAKEEPISYVLPPKPIEEKPKPIVNQVPTSLSLESPNEIKPVFTQEELIPTLKPKIPIPTPIPAPVVTKEILTEKAVPESAVITTYSRDILASENLITEQQPPKKNKKKAFLIICAALILSAIGGVVFAMVSGYISFPSFSFIKKDPKVLLLNTPALLANYESYTTTTNIKISLPSIANITNGLISGDAITSTDRDSVSLDTIQTIHKNKTSTTAPLYDYAFHIKSSLLKNDIDTHLVYDSSTYFVEVPDLHKLLGTIAPAPTTVSFKNNELDQVVSLLPDAYAYKVRDMDKYEILKNGIPPYIGNSIGFSLKEFINSATIIEKTPEDVDGTISYHYQFTVDRPSTKKFLGSLIDTFVATIPDAEKKNIDEVIGSAHVDTFEVWIGKGDEVIRKVKFSIAVPLSKILNLDDRGIADNEVAIDLETKYSGFNQSKNITIPENTVPISDFTDLLTDQKINNTLVSFSTDAKSFHNAVGSYGNRMNPTGSCTNPNPGSLFSPIGHPKGATNVIGSIASKMNTLLNTTNGAGYCFSTPAAWAMALPLASDVTSSYCADSTGTSTLLKTPLKGTVCK